MVERNRSRNVFPETLAPKSVFGSPAAGSPPALIEFLKLAEAEGAYGKISLKARQILEMRLIEGLNMPQIGDVLEISKQAVSQSLRLSPESLYKKMCNDVIIYRTNISFSEILAKYSAYKMETDAKKKGNK